MRKLIIDEMAIYQLKTGALQLSNYCWNVLMSYFTKAVSGVNHSVIYTDDSGKHFRFSGGTWAWRNHNPGNIRPGKISKKHGQIGRTYNNFAVFPDYESGHSALLEVLKTTYLNSSIDEMMAHFAPPSENNTARYRKFLHNVTGVQDNKKIKNFTPSEFKKLWKGIEKLESSKEGTVVEVYIISNVRVDHKGTINSYCTGDGWISKKQCIELARKGRVDLEICISILGNAYLKVPPSSFFQKKLSDLIAKDKT